MEDAALEPEIEEEEPSTVVETLPSSEIQHLSTVTLPTIIIDNAHTLLTTADPIIEVVLSGKEGTPRKEKAAKVERALHGTYYINRQNTGTDPISDSILNQLVFGWGCIYTVWDPYRGEELVGPEKGDDDEEYPDYDFPIIVESVHPLTVYAVPGARNGRWKTIMRIYERTIADIEAEWGIDDLIARINKGKPKKDQMEDDAYQLVEYRDVWYWAKVGKKDVVHHAVQAGGEFIKAPIAMPKYKSLPYTIFFCRPFSDDAPEGYGLSLLFPVIEPVEELESLISRMNRAVDAYADPILVVEAGPDQEVEQVDKRPGAVFVVPSGGRVYYVNWQGSPPDASALISLQRSLIQEASFPNVTFGQQGGTSGLDTISLQQGGLVRVEMPKRQAEIAIQTVNSKIISLIQNFLPADQSLFVKGVRRENNKDHPFSLNLKKEDLNGISYTWVKIQPRFPQAALRNAAIAQGLVQAGMYDEEDALTEFLYVQDPVTMLKKIKRRKVMNNEALLGLVIQMAAQKIMAGRQEPQNVQPPGPPLPPGPVGPEGGPMMPPNMANAASGMPPGGGNAPSASELIMALRGMAEEGTVGSEMTTTSQYKNLGNAIKGKANAAQE
jgi:hypothetical protein